MKLLPSLKQAKLGLFPKLLVTFLLVLSPLYLIGLRINLSGSENIRSEISNSLSSRVNLYTEILERDFNRVLMLMQEYINDEDLLKLSNTSEIMSDIEKTQSILRLKGRLDLLKSTSSFVENAMVSIPSLERTITSNEMAISSFDRPMFDALSKPDRSIRSPFQLYNNRVFISLTYPSPALSQHPVFVLAVEVSREHLSEALQQFTSSGGGALLAGNQVSWGVSGSLDPGLSKQLSLQKNLISANSDRAETVLIGDSRYLAVMKDSEALDTRMVMVVPAENVEQPLQTHRTWLLILSVVSFIIIIIFSYSIYRMIQRPLRTLVSSFRKVEQGNFQLSLQYPYRDEFGFLYEQFNSTVKQLGVLVHEVYEQQYRTRHAELRHLQSQINPHFLYNTYFILYRMAQLHDTDNVIHLTKHLGEYFQYITRDGMQEVELEKEVKNAATYTEIQTVRFANRIRAVIGEVPEEARRVLVPRLILQPIIENAYNHALEKNPRGGWLKVDFLVDEDGVTITVEDSGGEMSDDKLRELQVLLLDHEHAKESTGVLNVHRRLRIKYGSTAGLNLSIGEEKGLKVAIRIPIQGESQP